MSAEFVMERDISDPWMISVKTVGGDINLEGGGEVNPSGERQFTIQVSPNDHLGRLHDQIEASTGLKASQQRLIYRGRLIGSQFSEALAPASAASKKDTGEDEASTCDSKEQTRIRDIAGLADGQTIHLVKRRKEESENEGRDTESRRSASATARPRSSTIPSEGSSSDRTSGGLLAALLGLSSMSDDAVVGSTARRWPQSRMGRTTRRPHYRMSAEDRQVPDPGSAEPVRQGLMTLHTLLPHLQGSDFESPLQSNRRWYRGQWLDCLDTVNAWLEATVVDIFDPADILPQAYATAVSTSLSRRRDAQIHNDPAVSASDMDGRLRLLVEPCDPEDEHDLGGDLTGHRPRPSNRGVQILLIHYNGWPHRWDEWIRSDSARLRPFRTRTRHPDVSSAASPTPQSIFHESPSTNFLQGSNEMEDRIALLPELARVMNSVNDVLQRQVASASQNSIVDSTADGGTEETRQSISVTSTDLPWISRMLPRQEAPTTPVEDSVVPPIEGETPSNIVEPYEEQPDNEENAHNSNSDDSSSSIDSMPELEPRYNADISEDSEDEESPPLIQLGRRIENELNFQYNRHELQNLATLLDRLGRTLTDAAPQVASLAANLPSGTTGQLPTPEDTMIEEAVDQALEEIAESFPDDEERPSSETSIGGLLSLWSRERRNRLTGSTGASIRRGGLAPAAPSVDPDHEDYVSGLVNTTRGEVRSGPRSRSSNDEVANVLGAYLAAAALGGSSGDGGRDDGRAGLGQLLRGGTGGGGGIEIHINAVVTGPDGAPATGGLGLGALGGDSDIMGIGGPRNLFSANRRNSGTASLRRSRSGSRGNRRQVAASRNEDDIGIFDELYSETPHPVDPNGSPASNERQATESARSTRLPISGQSGLDVGRDNSIEDQRATRSRSYGRVGGTGNREQMTADDVLSRMLDHTNVGAASLAGRGVSSTRRRRISRRSFRRPSVDDRSEDGASRRPLSGLRQLFRRRSSRSDNQS